MPRVPKEWLDSVVYLYETEEDAKAGNEGGGTGFIVSIPGEDPALSGLAHYYVVTNDHVRVRARALRLNLKGSGVDVLPIKPDEWTPHQENDDVAVFPLQFSLKHRCSSVNREMILSTSQQARWDFGPGDDVFFIGRYTKLDGTQSNIPTVRSGIVSALPAEPISQPNRAHIQDTILVEARSLGGYSGSPVFVSRAPRIEREPQHDDAPKVPVVRLDSGSPCFLLGIDYGHHPWSEPVRDRNAKGNPSPDLYVEGNSGMMMVVPGEKLLSLLDTHPDLVQKRRESERVELEHMDDPAAVLDSEQVSDAAEDFDHFERLTDKDIDIPGSPRGRIS